MRCLPAGTSGSDGHLDADTYTTTTRRHQVQRTAVRGQTAIRLSWVWLALLGHTILGICQTRTPVSHLQPARTPSEQILYKWNKIGNKLVAMAEDFPENKYDFRPTPAQRTFAESLLHVVGEDYRLLSAIKGSHMGPAGYQDHSPKDFKTKADVVRLMKQVVADGAALIAERGDAGLQREVRSPYADVLLRAWYVWVDAIEHSGEHYGQLVVYYRVAGMVPPDSRPPKPQ
jgi:uncharacterized damage-inducible protein DinB